MHFYKKFVALKLDSLIFTKWIGLSDFNGYIDNNAKLIKFSPIIWRRGTVKFGKVNNSTKLIIYHTPGKNDNCISRDSDSD